VIVVHAAPHNSPQVGFAEYDDVIDALPAQSANYSLCVRGFCEGQLAGRRSLPIRRVGKGPERSLTLSIPVPCSCYFPAYREYASMKADKNATSAALHRIHLRNKRRFRPCCSAYLSRMSWWNSMASIVRRHRNSNLKWFIVT